MSESSETFVAVSPYKSQEVVEHVLGILVPIRCSEGPGRQPHLERLESQQFHCISLFPEPPGRLACVPPGVALSDYEVGRLQNDAAGDSLRDELAGEFSADL